MADENLDAYLHLSTTEIKADIDTTINCFAIELVCCVLFFAKITLSRSQTESFKFA